MKSCEYIKGRIGLTQYRDSDVFAGYKIIKLDNRNYVSDSDEKNIYNNIGKIRTRVIKNCKLYE